MATTYDLADPARLLAGIRAARQAIGRGSLVIMPTDTVYGLAADAFNPQAVQALLAAKGRDRTSPPPVLIPNVQTLHALGDNVTPAVTVLTEAFWPGALTVIVRARPSLGWDLGDTRGTVALRIPAHPLAIELLEDTGPLAVSSANLHGMAAPTRAATALGMLGGAVEVVLDAGDVGGDYAPHEQQNGSTIIDATGEQLCIVRQGVLSRERLGEVLPQLLQESIADSGSAQPGEDSTDA